MSQFVLRDEGYPFKKIYNGRKWVGRVCKHMGGGYLGRIGSACDVRASTELEAFKQVVAKHLGYESPDALRQHNRQVRQANKAARARGRAAADALMDRNFEQVCQLLGLNDK